MRSFQFWSIPPHARKILVPRVAIHGLPLQFHWLTVEIELVAFNGCSVGYRAKRKVRELSLRSLFTSYSGGSRPSAKGRGGGGGCLARNGRSF